MTTTGNQITFDLVFGSSDSGTYMFSDAYRTLMIDFGGLQVAYTRT